MDSNRPFELIVQRGNTIVANVSTEALLKIPAFNSAARFISETIAPMRIKVLDGEKNEHKEHEAYRILNIKANGYAGPTKTKETHLLHAVTYGNGYNRIKRVKGKITAYENLIPYDTTPFLVDGIKYFYIQSTKEVLNNWDVVHVMGISHDGVVGVDPKYLLCDTFETARVLQKYQLSYFKNGSFINGVITVPAGTPDDQFKAMVNAWNTSHTVDKAGKTGFLLNGAQWSNTTSDNSQTKLPELRNTSDTDIARITRVHPSVIYALANGTLAGLESSIIKTSLRTWVEQLEDEYTLKMLTTAEINNGWHIKIDTNELLRGDPQRIGVLIQMTNAGLATPNEARAELDMGPIDGGDIVRMPVNVAKPVAATAPAGETPAADAAEQGADAAVEPSDAPESTPEPPADSQKGGATYAKLGPILSDVAKRVETKGRKAYEAHKGKPGFSEWIIDFANKQGAYLRDALEPTVAVTAADFTSVIREYEEAVMSETVYPLEEKLNAILSN